MAYIVSNLAYLLILFFDLAAVLLVLEWFVHALPGAWLNSLRRSLFQVLFPFLKFSDQFLSLKWDSFNSRGLLTAGLLLALGHYGLPWLVAAGFSMRG